MFRNYHLLEAALLAALVLLVIALQPAPARASFCSPHEDSLQSADTCHFYAEITDAPTIRAHTPTRFSVPELPNE